MKSSEPIRASSKKYFLMMSAAFVVIAANYVIMSTAFSCSFAIMESKLECKTKGTVAGGQVPEEEPNPDPDSPSSDPGTLEDRNGDGVADTRVWTRDTNNDGHIDARLADTNLNGKVEETLYYDASQPNGRLWVLDPLETGVPAQWGYDMNGDQRVDTWGWDLNHNNVFDAWAWDTNNNGIVDRIGFDNNEDAQIEQQQNM